MLADILGGIGFISGILGIGGLCGAIENGNGLIISLILIVAALVLIRWSMYEYGYLRHKKRTPTDQSKRFFR